MTAPPQVTAPRQATVFEMYRALVGVGAMCGLLIVTVFELTKPIIAANRAEALQRAVFEVIPDARSSQTYRVSDGVFRPTEEEGAGGDLVVAGYDAEGHLVGVALQAQAMGYQDVITVLYGYSFETEAIVGMRVLESKETPGLGDKIEKDDAFLANFESLDVSLAAGGDALANPIEAVKSGEKEHAWQIDGITGATISSVAIANMLRDSAERWVPMVAARRADFAGDGAP